MLFSFFLASDIHTARFFGEPRYSSERHNGDWLRDVIVVQWDAKRQREVLLQPPFSPSTMGKSPSGIHTKKARKKNPPPLLCAYSQTLLSSLSLASNRPSPNFPSLFLPKRYLTDIHNEYRWQVQYPKITHTYAYRYNHPIPLSKTKRNTKKTTTMGSSHSKPKKHRQPVRKPQISYPRPHNPPSKQHQQQQTHHHHLHHPLEPQYYGNSPAVHPHPQPRRPARPSLQPKAKPVSVYAPEVNYYGTFPAAVVARKRVVAKAEGNTMNKRVDGMKQQGIVRRKPVPPPQNRAQVEHYARRGLPPVPGSRAAVRSVKVQYGYC